MTCLFFVWAALSGVLSAGDDKKSKTEEITPLAAEEVESLAGDWELVVDPKKSPLKALRATITITQIKSAAKPPTMRGRILYHFTIDTPAVKEEVENAPIGGIEFLPIVKEKKHYLQIVPERPVKTPEKLFVEFTLEKDVWTINASKSKGMFFPGAIPEMDLPWDKLVWKRVPKKGK